jgi:hypothetical protein
MPNTLLVAQASPRQNLASVEGREAERNPENYPEGSFWGAPSSLDRISCQVAKANRDVGYVRHVCSPYRMIPQERL